MVRCMGIRSKVFHGEEQQEKMSRWILDTQDIDLFNLRLFGILARLVGQYPGSPVPELILDDIYVLYQDPRLGSALLVIFCLRFRLANRLR